MLTMLRKFTRPSVGLDISSRSASLGAVAGRKGMLSLVAARSVALPPGMVVEGFSSLSVRDPEGLLALLRPALQELGATSRRAGLSLPDGLFRVQMLEFDDLPSGSADRERLIRWRLEKTSAFDASGTVLRYQAVPQEDRKYSVLACVAKSDVLAQYEDVLAGLGLDLWTLGPASFHALNVHAPEIGSRSIQQYALVWVTEGAYSTLVVEGEGLRFYRYREIKPGAPGDVADRLVRELDDTLHFYTHRDRQQTAGVRDIFLAGDGAAVEAFAERLTAGTSYAVQVLPQAGAPAPVIGAGGLR